MTKKIGHNHCFSFFWGGGGAFAPLNYAIASPLGASACRQRGLPEIANVWVTRWVRRDTLHKAQVQSTVDGDIPTPPPLAAPPELGFGGSGW